jgi:hypothetical protein
MSASAATSPMTRQTSGMHSARDTAHRALFSAASRVLSYHAAALDAKVARITRDQAGTTQSRPAEARND